MQHHKTRQPEISVLIPTRGRPEQLARLLASLESQNLEQDRFEIIVGVDGGRAPEITGRHQTEQFQHAGPAATRNRLVDKATGEFVLFLNDDVVADRELVSTHIAAQRNLQESGRPAMILGDAPFAVPDDERLFDRLVRETSMIFFYNRMSAAEPDRNWGFRHAWTLNLSVPTNLVREHGFNESLDRAMFEDLEWAWRVQQSTRAPVLFRPHAKVTHEHRYEPRDYLARERELGRQAVRLAGINGACAAEVFGRDVSDPAFIDECRDLIERDAWQVEPLIESFRSLADMPADAASDPRLIQILYEHHLPLKRHLWRHGLVESAWSSAAA